VLFDNVRRALEEMICEIRGKRVPLTISIGVTTLVVNSVDAMISAADRLLYRAKQEGRNRVVIG
jgi:diguanylate cyclase (GGDEF)-like protein